MAPTNPKTKHKPETTNAGEEVLDLVIPYIHNVEDRNFVSLVSRMFYEIDGITRKSLTVHVHYYPNPASLSKRFPFIEALTLKGPPTGFYDRDDCGIRITPWIQQLALEFRCSKELHIRRLVVCDEDLETLMRIRGKDLRSLKISKCKGFSTDGLRHVSNYCNQLKTLCLEHCDYIQVKDGIWIHQLALNSTVLEKLHVTNMDIISNAEDLALLTKNCCNSLISLKIGDFYLSKLGAALRYAVRLERFAGAICDDEESELVDFRFPPNMSSLSIDCFTATRYSIVLPFVNHIRKLKLEFRYLYECQCFLFKRCPNLEVLYTEDECGDEGLQVIAQYCKKLRKLTHDRYMTHVGMIALVEGCANLECLDVNLSDISNESLECVGTHLKNLRDFRICLGKENGKTDLPLDNGVRAMLMGCEKLERLDIRLPHGGLTDVGLEYIGKYGSNLRSLSLTRIGNSDAGLVKLLEGCLKLRKLNLSDCPLSEQVVTSCVFNILSLRYVWFESCDRVRTTMALTRPEFRL